MTCGAIIEPVGTASPRIVARWIASMSIAWYIAWRTRLSLNGFLPLTFVYGVSSRHWSKPKKMIRVSVPSAILICGFWRSRGMSCVGGSSTRSISPDSSAAARVASDLIGW